MLLLGTGAILPLQGIGKEVTGWAKFIALRYILGFDDTLHIPESEHHLRQADSLPAEKAGKMERFLDEVFK